MSKVTELRYRAFLSYSHADTAEAKKLHTRLERFRIDKDLVGRQTEMGRIPTSLHPIFRDRDDFSAGKTLTAQTIAALDAAAALIVVCSPDAARSRYVNEEIRLFKTNHGGRPIVPVIVGGHPGDPKRECFPPALRFVVAADGTITNQFDRELLAADARSEADGWKLATAKVVAGLLGLHTDEVFRRAEHTRRRQRLIRAVGGLALLALLIGGSILLRLNYQQQGTIESLLAKLAPIGVAQGAGLDITASLKEVITEIARRATTNPRQKRILELLEAGKLIEAAHLQKAYAEDLAAHGARASKDVATAYRHLGAIAFLSDPKGAREAYGRALEFYSDDPESLYWYGFLNLLAGNLSIAERSLDQLMAVSAKANSSHGRYRAHLRLGEIERARGDLARSMEHQETALAIAEATAVAQPRSAEWQTNFSISREKIGDVLQAQGNFAAALESYRTSFAIRDQLAKADPGNAEWQRNLSVSDNKIGDVLRSQRDLVDAMQRYKAALAIRERLEKAHPGNIGWQMDLSVSHEKIGDVLQIQGIFPAAAESYNASFIIRDRISRADPDNFSWQASVSVSHEKLGDVLQAQGDPMAALENYNASFAIRDRLAKADPGNTEWQRNLSVSYSKIGDVLRDQGDLRAALDSFEAAFVIRDRLARANPENAIWQVDLALSYARLGQLHRALGDRAEALRLFKMGRKILAPILERSGNKLWTEYLRNFDAAIDALEK